MISRLVLVFSLLFFAVPLSPPLAIADEGSDAAGIEEIEEIEEIVEVGEVEEVTPSDDKAGLFPTIGKFHPVVLHFPIAWLVLLVLVEAVILTGFADGLSRWGLALLVLTILSFIPATVSGLGLATTYADSAADFMDKMILHRNLNIASGIVLLLALFVRLKAGPDRVNKLRPVYFLLLLTAAGLMIYGSHLGGEMVWGEGFLPTPF